MTATVCRHCGAEVAAGVQAACRDCRLAPDPSEPPTLPAGDDGGAEEVAFDLAEWPAPDRVAVGVALDDEGVPWRWEPGPLLVVRELDEAVLEELLDDTEGGEGAWEDVEGEEADEEADEEAQTAMSELFLAADRLVRAPWNAEIAAEVAQLQAVVEASSPPFGVEPALWERIASLAAAVTTAGEEGDEEDVEEAARSLRDLLRQYI